VLEAEISKMEEQGFGFCFVWFGLVVGSQGLTHTSQVLYYLSHLPALFCFGFFQNKVS
jgi:hypothetical protein